MLHCPAHHTVKQLPTRDTGSLREELSELVGDIQKYRTAHFAENVQEKIHSVAMNAAVSQQVVSQVQSELLEAHGKYFRLCVLCGVILLLPFAVCPLAGLLLGCAYFDWLQNQTLFWLLPAGVAAEIFVLRYLDWRAVHARAYIAYFLVQALEIGLEYQDDSVNTDLRDRFATSIQRAATRYSMIFKGSDSTRFSKA
jgi:hypothetical protein